MLHTLCDFAAPYAMLLKGASAQIGVLHANCAALPIDHIEDITRTGHEKLFQKQYLRFALVERMYVHKHLGVHHPSTMNRLFL